MNNFTILNSQQRKQNKHNHSTLLPSDITNFKKEPKTSDQTLLYSQKSETSQSTISSGHYGQVENSVRFELENYFDSILEKMAILPLHLAIEPILTDIYKSYKSILWISKDFKSFTFYSPTLDFNITGENTLLAAASRAKTSIVCPPSMDSLYNDQAEITEEVDFEKIESECSKMFFPLYLKSGNVIAIAEILRTNSQNPFDDNDLKIASFLIRKFLLYGSVVLNPSETVFFASEFSHIASPNNVYKKLSSSLISGFKCKIVDFWCHHNNSNDLLKLDSESGQFIQPPKSNIGVVTAAIRNKTNINLKSPRYHPNFSFHGDPLPDEPILISSYEIDDCIFATVLRGETIKKYFSTEEESKLEAVMPFISRSLLFSVNVAKKDVQKKDPFEIQLTELLDCEAFFSTQLNYDDLITAIQERSAKIVKAKSCCFILYDYSTNQFIFNHGNDKLPGNLGLTGNVANFGAPIRISSPMSDSRFDKRIDLEVHKEEEIDSMLIVPVYSVLEKIIGVISLANKIKQSEFTEEDARVIKAIASLASISLQNSKIYQTSIGLNQKLNSFVRIKNEKSKNDKLNLLKILKKAHNEPNVYRVSLFLSKEEKEGQEEELLLLYRSIGGPPEQGTRFSLPSLQQGKQISYPVNDDLSERITAPLSSRATHYSARQVNTAAPAPALTATPTPATNSNKVDMGTSPSPSQNGRLICCNPVSIPNKSTDSNELIGVIEICTNSIGTQEEIDLFQNFCNVVVLSIKENAADEIRSIRNEQFALQEMIPESERDLFTVPSLFKEKVPDNLFTRDFDITTIDPKYQINLVFAIFNKFGLMHEFEIQASKLFFFIYRLQNLFADQKKWQHSIETTCFLSYLLLTTKFDEKLPRYELLSLIIASLCHDIDPNWPILKDEEQATTVPLDSIYAKRSVFESNSCFEAISLLSSSDSNLLEKVGKDKINFCSELIIQLILATDYYKHYQLLHDFKALISNTNNVLNYDNQKVRLFVIEILLKCADVGVIGRNKDIADKYQDNICDEFFSHGPYDKAREIMFTSSILKDRRHIEKKKSTKSIMESVFAPMFRLILKVFPQLDETCNCVLDNISRWTSVPHHGNDLPMATTTPNISANNKLGPDEMLEKE